MQGHHPPSPRAAGGFRLRVHGNRVASGLAEGGACPPLAKRRRCPRCPGENGKGVGDLFHREDACRFAFQTDMRADAFSRSALLSPLLNTSGKKGPQPLSLISEPCSTLTKSSLTLFSSLFFTPLQASAARPVARAMPSVSACCWKLRILPSCSVHTCTTCGCTGSPVAFAVAV